MCEAIKHRDAIRITNVGIRKDIREANLFLTRRLWKPAVVWDFGRQKIDQSENYRGESSCVRVKALAGN